MNMYVQNLITFENKIADLYQTGIIRAPIHLRNGNEQNLIDIFKDIKGNDYVFTTWASHLHALLKGVPEEDVKRSILKGESITLHYPEYRFYSSAIVGGIAPIAVGVADSILINNKNERVFCFIGDMALHNGVVLDAIQYAIKMNLPITWIIEDNNKSVCTPTDSVCINTELLFNSLLKLAEGSNLCKLMYYSFTSTWPHSGTGNFVSF